LGFDAFKAVADYFKQLLRTLEGQFTGADLTSLNLSKGETYLLM
jgi:hypothetical protein